MIKKISKLAFVLSAIALMSSCSITAPLTATGNPIGKKVGTAKANVILGLTFGGDYGIQTAAKNGGITKVSTVDVKHKNILFLFMSYQTIVTGE
jgi:hypothetical protein